MSQSVTPSDQEREILLKYANNDEIKIPNISDIQDVITKPVMSLPSNNTSTFNDPNQFNFDREAEENNALNDPNWKPRLQYDIQDPPVLQKGFQVLMRERYALNAIKRINPDYNKQFYQNILKNKQTIDNDYYFILNELSIRKAQNLSEKLANYAKKLICIDHNIFNTSQHKICSHKLITSIVYEYACKNKYSNLFLQNELNEPSLLYELIAQRLSELDKENLVEQNRYAFIKLLGVGNCYNNIVYDIEKFATFNPNIYLQLPNSIDDFIKPQNNIDIKKDYYAPAFHNLINAAFLYCCQTMYHQGLNKEPNIIAKLYNESYLRYLERHDFLPFITCLNRDLTAILHKQFDQEGCVSKIGHISKGSPITTFEEFLSRNIHPNPFYINTSEQETDDNGTISNDNSKDDWDDNYYLPFNANCIACVAAYELIRQGWMVAALPNMQSNVNYVYELSFAPNLIWKDPLTESSPDISYIDNINNLKYICCDNERYHLLLRHNSAKDKANILGHIVSVERYNNEVTIYDPQINEYTSIDNCSNFFEKRCKLPPLDMYDLYYYRVDNCIPVISYANKIVGAPTAKPQYQTPMISHPTVSRDILNHPTIKNLIDKILSENR